MAESMSAYLATCSVFFLFDATDIFRSLQKYSLLSRRVRRPYPLSENFPMWRGDRFAHARANHHLCRTQIFMC